MPDMRRHDMTCTQSLTRSLLRHEHFPAALPEIGGSSLFLHNTKVTYHDGVDSDGRVQI